ncbi:MAG: PEP-CTERM sorting domain-containing protein [Proteobacteria bacterium]|nr:PEP-CTERM sorting domain-containing protein [Pseudomonadota bacterium]
MRLNHRQFIKTLAPVVGLVTLLASGTASSLAIPYDSNIRINFAGWNESTTAYNTSCGAIGAPNFAACVTAAAVLPRDAYGDSTWGIARITTMTANGSTFYSDPVGSGEHFSAFFYSLNDGVVVQAGAPTTTSTYSYNGILQVWSNIGSDPIVGVPTPAGRTGPTTYPAVQGGTLVLDVLFAPGGSAASPSSNLNGSFLDFSIGGGSASLFNIIGGTWAPYFKNDYVLGFDGNYHSLEASIAFRCGGGAINVECNPANTNPQVMSLAIDGSFFGKTIPEPSTLLLMVPGLLLLARRHRSQA